MTIENVYIFEINYPLRFNIWNRKPTGIEERWSKERWRKEERGEGGAEEVFRVTGDTSGRAEKRKWKREKSKETSEGHRVGKYDNKWEVRGHGGRLNEG